MRGRTSPISNPGATFAETFIASAIHKFCGKYKKSETADPQDKPQPQQVRIALDLMISSVRTLRVALHWDANP